MRENECMDLELWLRYLYSSINDNKIMANNESYHKLKCSLIAHWGVHVLAQSILDSCI